MQATLMRQIEVLELKEKEMIKKLKNTQTLHHNLTEDFHRIGKNEEPLVLFSDEKPKGTIGLSKRWNVKPSQNIRAGHHY